MFNDMLTTACATQYAAYELDTPVSQEDLSPVQPSGSVNIVALSTNGHIEYLVSGTRTFLSNAAMMTEALVTPTQPCTVLAYATI